MATHEFGIMQTAPRPGERYDNYEPEKYHCIAVHDDWIEPLMPQFEALSVFWPSLDWPEKGLNYCGITLIPPEELGKMADITRQMVPELFSLTLLLEEAAKRGKYVIHYGL